MSSAPHAAHEDRELAAMAHAAASDVGRRTRPAGLRLDPAVAREVAARAADEPDALCGLVGRDPALAALALQLANAVSGGVACVTVRDAVDRLGAAPVAAIAERFPTWCDERDAAERTVTERTVTERARAVALLARAMAPWARVDAALAHTAALMRSVGPLAIAQGEDHDVDPAALGAWLLASWALPAPLPEAALRRGDAARGPEGRLFALLDAAEALHARCLVDRGAQAPLALFVDADGIAPLHITRADLRAWRDVFEEPLSPAPPDAIAERVPPTPPTEEPAMTAAATDEAPAHAAANDVAPAANDVAPAANDVAPPVEDIAVDLASLWRSRAPDAPSSRPPSPDEGAVVWPLVDVLTARIDAAQCAQRSTVEALHTQAVAETQRAASSAVAALRDAIVDAGDRSADRVVEALTDRIEASAGSALAARVDAALAAAEGRVVQAVTACVNQRQAAGTERLEATFAARIDALRAALPEPSAMADDADRLARVEETVTAAEERIATMLVGLERRHAAAVGGAEARLLGALNHAERRVTASVAAAEERLAAPSPAPSPTLDDTAVDALVARVTEQVTRSLAQSLPRMIAEALAARPSAPTVDEVADAVLVRVTGALSERLLDRVSLRVDALHASFLDVLDERLATTLLDRPRLSRGIASMQPAAPRPSSLVLTAREGFATIAVAPSSPPVARDTIRAAMSHTLPMPAPLDDLQDLSDVAPSQRPDPLHT